MKNNVRGNIRSKWAWILAIVMTVSIVIPTSLMTAKAAVTNPVLVNVGGGEEAAYAQWSPVTSATGYNVYVKAAQSSDSSYARLDNQLIREYRNDSGQYYFRADAVGLSAGNYVMKIVPVISGSESAANATVTSELAVTSYDRTGFAWVNGSSNGAYNADGTLKSNAVVLYVTQSTKDTVSMNVVTSSKGTTTTAAGLQNILNLYKKGYDTRPLDIRMIGQITDLATMDNGDILISGSSDTKRLSSGVTLEGIGEDATAYGWGIRIKNASNVEVRNVGVMLCDSVEGDDIGLQQSNDHIWVHNCDYFYGEAGSDADQVKGDGSLDCKKSTYITFSYNHFYDNGKCNLLGLSEDTTANLYITYHHNWYDHSDSRHPRVRFYSAHVYNNYYDGNAKYGVGACLGSSVFVEGNYFRDCKHPMMISMQGSDVITDWNTLVRNEATATFSNENGGMIKAFNNTILDAASFVSYQQNPTEFDAYVVNSATEQVPSTVRSYAGNNAYNNFDTSSVMYSYTADSPEVAKTKVEQYAGRLNGGDFKWQFNNAVDDASTEVNTALKAAIESYQTKLVAVGGNSTSSLVSNVLQAKTSTVLANSQTSSSYDKNSTAYTGTYSSLSSLEDSNFVNKIYVSPNGSASASGTKSAPMSLDAALAYSATAQGNGVAILLMTGTYSIDHQLTIAYGNNGSATAYKVLKAAEGANVKLDFSAEPYLYAGSSADPSNQRGIQINGDYWYIGGFTIYKAADNGLFVGGSHNVVERCVLQANRDSGLQISRRDVNLSNITDWPSENYIINCTSFDNCDPATGENADGFASKLTCGTGNVFDGCISYCNCDDGWDLYAKEETGSIGAVTIRNCISFKNGTLTNGTSSANGDRNGFKLGGSNGKVPTAHVVINCLSFSNGKDGFTDNGNGGALTLTNCTSYKNTESNFNFGRTTAGGTFFHLLSSSAKGSDKFIGKISDAITFNSKKYYQVAFTATGTTVTSGAKVGTVVSDPEKAGAFQSTTAPTISQNMDSTMRNTNGTVTTNGYLMTNQGSYASMGAKFNGSNQTLYVPANTTGV